MLTLLLAQETAEAVKEAAAETAEAVQEAAAEVAAVAEQAVQTPEPLSAIGWAFMLGSMAMVITLFGWCLTKVLSGDDKTEHMHAPLDIDTQDQGT